MTLPLKIASGALTEFASTDRIPSSNRNTFVTTTGLGSVTTDNTAKKIGELTLPTFLSGDLIEFMFSGEYTNTNTGATRNIQLSIKLGATTLFTSSSGGSFTNGNTSTWRIVGNILSTGAATQIAEGMASPRAAVVVPLNGTASESQTTPTLGVYLTADVATTTQSSTLKLGVAKVWRA